MSQNGSWFSAYNEATRVLKQIEFTGEAVFFQTGSGKKKLLILVCSSEKQIMLKLNQSNVVVMGALDMVTAISSLVLSETAVFGDHVVNTKIIARMLPPSQTFQIIGLKELQQEYKKTPLFKAA